MVDEKTDSQKPTPPYVPFLTLKGFIEALQGTAVPAVIDRSVMSKIAGGLQNQLLSGMKFLKLIGTSGEATEDLRKLVKSYNTSTWTSELGQVIVAAYAPITSGIDIQAASSKSLSDKFKEIGGVEGQMLDKCIRFYLKALQSANITVSPHFKDRKGATPKRTNSVRTTKEKLVETNAKGGFEPKDDLPSKGTIVIPIYLPGKPDGKVIVPEDLEESDCEMIDAILRAYAKRRHEKVK